MSNDEVISGMFHSKYRMCCIAALEGVGECNGANSFNRLFNDLNKKREWKSQHWPSDKLLGLKRI